MESDTSSPGNTLRDSIVTLPAWAVVTVAVISGVSLAIALWLAATSENGEVKATSIQLMLVLVPLASAVIAAIAVRRTSTAQIDRLVTGFLEKTLLERFEKWCDAPYGISTYAYPFKAVRLQKPTGGRSYAYFDFTWNESGDAPPASVGVKTNVFNFEVFTTLLLKPDAAADMEDSVITRANLDQVARHPILKHFIGAIQGSVNEGYEIKVEFLNPIPHGGSEARPMHLSLRQKVRENFLASPFLKRYFAEDASIVIGVIFNEYRASGLMASVRAAAPPFMAPGR